MEKKKIEEDCREIGTLFAMGYYRKEIVKNYIALPVAITVIGTVFGWIIGVFGLTKVLAKLSYSYYCFPNLKLDVSAECFLVSVICPIVFVAVIDWSILNRTLKVQPLKMLQNDFDPGFYIKHFVKDLRIALDQKEVKLTGVENVIQEYISLMDQGYQDLGTQALIKYFQ